jgi:succinoglycan biosynthesis protein ExoV
MDLRVICWKYDQESNFGDDLNRWLWSRVLGFPLDVDDETIVLGIGTVISNVHVPLAKRYIVISSGAGYDPKPADFGGPKWEILSVRGPLTAAVLNLPPEKAIIDGAALLRLLPECEPLPAAERAGIVFMPHYESLSTGNWRQVCEMAGFTFLDPFADSEETVQRIRKASLVIAGAMHAAIVADALRVPWIAVALSPQSNSFKWLDWTLSLNLPYRPVTVPASTLLEFLRNQSFRFYGEAFFLKNPTPSNAIKHYRRTVQRKSWKHWPTWRWRMMKLTYLFPRRVIDSAAFSGFKKQQDADRTCRAAEQLRRIAEMPSYLSDETIFMSRLEQIASLLPMLKG